MRCIVFFVMIVTIFTSGCASLESGEQVVVIRSNVQGAQISGAKNENASTPALIEVPRQRHYSLYVKDGKSVQELNLKGKYRWGKSFFGNFVLFGLAPVGWLLDLWTGKAFQYNDEYEVEFQQAKVLKKKDSFRVAVAPPRYADGDLADRIGKSVVEHLRHRLGKEATVVNYEESLPTFEQYGFDFDKDIKSRRDPKIFKRLGVDRIFQSEVKVRDNDFSVEGQYQDIFDPENNAQETLLVKGRDISPEDHQKFFSRSNVFFYILPNTVTLDFSSVNTDLTVRDESDPALEKLAFRGQSASTDGLIGEVAKYLAVLSLRRIDPPLDRKSWRFKLSFSPTINLSYAAEKFDDLPELQDKKFIRSHFDLGYGPSLTYSNRKWVLYGNLFFSMAYDKIEGDKAYDNWGSSSTVELGLMYFIKRDFSARLFTRTISVPQKLWGQSLRDASQRPLLVESSQLLTSGLSLGYSLF